MHPWNQPILDSLAGRLDRLPHALLVHGPQGVGKLELAEALSQALLCESSSRKPCNTCDACRWFLAGNHPDFRRLEPEAIAKQPEPLEDEAPAKKTKQPSIVIKIDQVRNIFDFVYTVSHRGGRRVVLIHPAEHLQWEAAEALLKSLEEPPPAALFILVSHRPAHLIPTIRSRCVPVPVPIPPRETALAWLAQQKVANAEKALAYAGGAPLRAKEHHAVSLTPVFERDGLEPLADALQKTALDHALRAFGLPAKYGTTNAAVAPEKAREWLAYARRMGEDRLLCRHPLNPRLFSGAMLAAKPKG
jgi:DNA polymerase-3 subunit delta'